MTKLYVVKILQSMLVNNSHLCSQSQHEHTHAKNHQFVEWIWIDKNELMQMMCYPWPGDTTLTKTICRKYTLWFFNKGSSLRCFAEWFSNKTIYCVLKGAEFKFEDKGKIFQHAFRIYRLYEMEMIVFFMVFTRTSIFIAWSRSCAVPFTVRSSKCGCWVSTWSTRQLNTTTTWHRTWLPVPPLRPLTVNCTFMQYYLY